MSGSLLLRVGTRESRLACRQADQVVRLLVRNNPGLACELTGMTTEGDRRAEVPLTEMAGRGVFTGALEEALRSRVVDVVVHSLKDLPTEEDPELCLAALPSREDPRECLISGSGGLQALPEGSVVGTSSTRREAQLRALRPDLVFRPIRGNVDTRIRKVVEQRLYDATVLAAAGIRRLGMQDQVREWFSLDRFLPAPGQGALAVQCRREDVRTRSLLSAIDDLRVRVSVTAERAFLEALGGGCTLPVAAFARLREPGPGGLHLRGSVFSIDGRRSLSVSGSGEDPVELGHRLAEEALGRGATGLIAGNPGTGPLSGKKVVITRAADQAGYLSDRLRSLGARPVLVPVIRIVPREDNPRLRSTLARSGDYDWIVFTSASAVNGWCQLGGHSDPAASGNPRIAAVGPKTAAALQRHGVSVDLIPADYSKESLVEALGDVRGLRFLVPRGDLAGPELARGLRNRGAAVEDVVIYATRPAAPPPEEFEHLVTGMDAVLFTSSSTVRNFMAVVDRTARGRALLRGVAVTCIGPATSRSAQELGLKVSLVARHHTAEGLVEALLDYYEKSPDESSRSHS